LQVKKNRSASSSFRWLIVYHFHTVFIPQPLRSKSVPFDDPQWIFELKYDGFRALAYLENGRCRLISRNGTTFASFSNLASSIGSSINRNAVLDGEIVCLDSNGCPQFNDLLFHRGDPCFFAFDILSLNGRDLRWNALIERKAELRRLLGSKPQRVLYADHVERDGCRLFELICQRDLEGIVAKLKYGNYTSEKEQSTWIKVKNREYGQAKGRAEFFDRGRKPVQSIHAGWDSCALVCEDMEIAL
jgi:bifunctional non-homologous end joining protein LigD